MKNKTILFYIIENEKIDVEQNISEAKQVYSDIADMIHIIHTKDYLAQIFRIIQNRIMDESDEIDKMIILTNHLIGPIYPLQEVFNKMDQVSCDFWTLTKVGQNIARNVREHFQFYFCVFNRSFFQNDKIPNLFGEDKCVTDEITFSDMLTECDAHGETYINTDLLEEKARNCRIDASLEIPYLLVKEYAYPYIRFEAFTSEIDINIEIQRLMAYLKETQLYDVSRIWEYLLASCDITDIYTRLMLHYVYSSKSTAAERKKYSNTALLVHLYYEDQTAECLDHIEPLADMIDIYISTGNDSTYELITAEAARRKAGFKEVRKIENRGRDVASLLYYCKDIWDKYEYFGFLHDKKSSGTHDILYGYKFRYSIWENLAASREYVCNIIEGFRKDARLGLVVPPMPKHDEFRSLFWRTWEANFENMKHLARRLQLKVPMDEKKPLFAFSTCFWCRTRALEKLYKCRFDISEFDLVPFPPDGTLSHAIERILPFVAQDAGFYTASIETEEFASVELAYYFDRMQEIKTYRHRADVGMYSILGFISRFKKIYVYGCGKISHEVTDILLQYNINFEGYVVTKKEIDFFCDKPVYSLDDISADDDIGIIVAVGVKLKPEIEVLLRNKGIDYYLWRQ